MNLIKKRSELISKNNINLKINTTLTSINWMDNFTNFLEELNPKRWKVFEVHKIHGINDVFFQSFKPVTKQQIKKFLQINKDLHPIFESSNIIEDSYCMITPDGRFYQDTNLVHNYSDKILDVGILEANNQVYFNKKKYLKRNANYFKKFHHKSQILRCK